MTKSKLHIYRITKREEEIINLLMDGFSYKEITQRLYISITTLRSHIINIFKKKQVNSLQQLLVKEYKRKIEIIKYINSGMKCDKSCIGHSLYTHNLCMTCKALKDSPYHQDYLKDKTDEEIADDIMQGMKELEDE